MKHAYLKIIAVARIARGLYPKISDVHGEGNRNIRSRAPEVGIWEVDHPDLYRATAYTKSIDKFTFQIVTDRSVSSVLPPPSEGESRRLHFSSQV